MKFLILILFIGGCSTTKGIKLTTKTIYYERICREKKYLDSVYFYFECSNELTRD